MKQKGAAPWRAQRFRFGNWVVTSRRGRPIHPSLRTLLNRATGKIQLSVQPVKLSVMTHNMALLVAPGDYLGTDRDGAIAEIIAQIAARLPDVVGLCEVFSDGERETIRNSLRNIYPFFREGPDEADLESDGGLLLLSRHPIWSRMISSIATATAMTVTPIKG